MAILDKKQYQDIHFYQGYSLCLPWMGSREIVKDSREICDKDHRERDDREVIEMIEKEMIMENDRERDDRLEKEIMEGRDDKERNKREMIEVMIETW